MTQSTLGYHALVILLLFSFTSAEQDNDLSCNVGQKMCFGDVSTDSVHVFVPYGEINDNLTNCLCYFEKKLKINPTSCFDDENGLTCALAKEGNRIISNLKRFTEYSVCLVTEGSNDTPLCLNQRTALGVPSIPLNFRASEIKSNEISLAWDPPEEGPEAVSSYGLYFNGSFTTTSNTTYKVENLQPLTEYEFHVQAVANETAGKNANLTVSTIAPNAWPPDSMSATPDTDSFTSGIIVEWTWDRGDAFKPFQFVVTCCLANDCRYYIVKNDGSNRLFTEPLQFYSKYTVVVEAMYIVNNKKFTSDPVYKIVQTYPGSPGQVLHQEVTKAISNQVTLSWYAPLETERNGPINGYVIRTTKGGKTVKTEYYNSSSEGEMQYTVMNLNPYSEYAFEVVAYNQVGGRKFIGALPKPVQAKTAPGPPSEAQNITHNSLSPWAESLSWQEPQEKNGPLDGYYVTWKSSQQGPISDYVYDNTLNLTDLQQKTLYQVFVQACNERSLNETSENDPRPKDKICGNATVLNVTTDYIAPPAPFDLNVTDVLARRVTLRWNGTVPEKFITTHFKVSAEPNITEKIVSSTRDAFPVEDLKPYQDYTVYIASCNDDRCSSRVGVYVKTEADSPGIPEKLDHEFNDGDLWTVFTNWKEPVTKNGPLMGYVAAVCREHDNLMECRDQNVSQANAVFGQLKLRTKYVLNVQAFNVNSTGAFLVGPKANESFETGIIGPPPPGGLRPGIVRATAIEVIWDPLEQDSKYIVDLYIVSVNGQGYSVGKSHSMLKTGFSPWTEYNFTVQGCVNDSLGSGSMMCGDETSPLTVRTKPTMPDEVLNVTYEFKDSWTVSLQWEKPKVLNGPLDGYYVTWQSKSDYGHEYTKNATFTLPRMRMRQTYMIVIRGCNNRAPEDQTGTDNPPWDKQCGVTKDLNISTPVSAPPAPEGLREDKITSTSIQIAWDAMDTSSKYIVDSYSLKFEGQNYKIIPSDKSKAVTFSKDGLQPWKDYKFSVAACVVDLYNNSGEACSDESNISIRTKEGPPSDVLNAKYEFKDSWTVSLQWEKPKVLNGPFDGYYVTYQNEFDNGHEYTKNATFAIQRMHMRQMYMIEIRGCNNRSGEDQTGTDDPPEDRLCGKPVSLNISTPVSAPPAPEGLREDKITSTSIQIAWDAMDANSKYIVDSYSLKFEGQNYNITAPTDGKDITYNKDGLQPWKNYKFNLSACVVDLHNNGGKVCGDESTTVIRTKAGNPGKVPQMSVTATSWDSLRIEWLAPEVRNGPIDGYEISWYFNDSTKPLDVRNEKELSYVITSLQADTDYRVTIEAYNREDNTKLFGSTLEAFGRTSKYEEDEGSNLRVILPAVLVPLILLIIGAGVLLFLKASNKGPLIGKFMNRRGSGSTSEPKRSFKNAGLVEDANY